VTASKPAPPTRKILCSASSHRPLSNLEVATVQSFSKKELTEDVIAAAEEAGREAAKEVHELMNSFTTRSEEGSFQELLPPLQE
jgi:hypothetical protein